MINNKLHVNLNWEECSSIICVSCFWPFSNIPQQVFSPQKFLLNPEILVINQEQRKIYNEFPYTCSHEHIQCRLAESIQNEFPTRVGLQVKQGVHKKNKPPGVLT
jgi:hypothetical protein